MKISSSDDFGEQQVETILCGWYHGSDGDLFHEPVCGIAPHYVTYFKDSGIPACKHHTDERVYMGQSTIAPLRYIDANASIYFYLFYRLPAGLTIVCKVGTYDDFTIDTR